MKIRSRAKVYRGINRKSAVIAKIYPGAVVRVAPRTRTEDCQPGWFERREGGFICGDHLKKTDETEARPSPEDRPDIRKGLEAVAVVKNHVPLYGKLRYVGRRRPLIELLKGSVLTIRGEVSANGERYYETREGLYVRAEGTAKLPAPIASLGVEIGPHGLPGAIVIGRNAEIRSATGARADVTGALPRWSVIAREGRKPLEVDRGFVSLPRGGFVSDQDVALVREAPAPKDLSETERWIAVDLEEQLLQVYDAARLIRVIPCSTGKKGNTVPGSYRIQKKLRRQHMRLSMNRVRVEDVQWVMYYDKEEAIAIHSAYWHDDFGTPVSHGCVNLPPDDARWLFEWTDPVAFPIDSVRVPLPRDSGTRVIVFR